MVVVASGCAFDGRKILPGIFRPRGARASDVDSILIHRVHLNTCEIPAAAPDAVLGVHLLPTLAGIVRSKESAVRRRGIDERIDPARVAGRNSEADPAKALRECGDALRQLLPGIATVHRFKESTAAAVKGCSYFPRRLPGSPQICVDNTRVFGIKQNLHGAGVLVLVQGTFKAFASVRGPIDPPFRIGAVRMAKHGDKQAIRIVWINDDRRNLVPAAQSKVLPS